MAMPVAQSPSSPPASAAARWPPLTFAPPNVERTDPTLARLRDQLLAAIRERRLDGVKALMAPTIRDQDAEVPAQEVLDSFGPLEPGTPPGDEWQALEQALRLGGIRRGNLYVVPFIERSASLWKARDERLFIAGRDVPVRANADPSASVVSRLSHALLQEAVGVPTRPGEAGADCADWTPVLDAERMLAWVCTADTRPVSGLYYAFARTGGAWKLTRIYAIPE
ncbi:MAG: hypothetical protein ABIT71_18155 [Vicinamibacteraceae bacterium]